jgi:alkylation response protein AidB-like acyl-CoA dehydrogenase
MSNPFDKGVGFLPVDSLDFSINTPEQFSEEEQMFIETAREFMLREVVPHADQLEQKDNKLMREIMVKAADLGLCAIEIQEEYGGLGLGVTTAAIVAEEVARDSNFATTWSAHTGIGTLPVVFFGTPEARAEVLPKSASCEWIGAYCLTEPGSGSDALAARTQAISDGPNWKISGNKQFITNGGFADYYVVFAQANPETHEAGRNFTGFVARRSDGGIHPQAEEDKLGMRGSSTTPILFDEAPVTAEHMLGREGKGHRIAFGILNIGRLKLAAAAVGGIKIALENTMAYVQERRQFDKTISQFQLTQHKIGVLAAETFAAESSLYRASGDIDRAIEKLDKSATDYGDQKVRTIEEFAVECAINKVLASEVLDHMVDEYVQLHGGYGYIAEYPAEGAYRNSRINRIWEGTNEINRMLIPGTIMRRAMKGKAMEVVGFQQGLMVALASGDAQLPSFEGPAAEALALAAQLRRLAIYCAGMAAAVYDRKIVREQEALVAVADLVIWSYAADASARRAHQSGADLQVKMATLYNNRALDQATAVACRLLRDLGAGEAIELIKPLTAPTQTNTTTLARELAQALFAAGKYRS